MRHIPHNSLIRRTPVFLLAAAVSLSAAGLSSAAPSNKDQSAPLTADQKAEHVLNRLGYGPRPGDIARVKKIGVKAYIERQLHPETIDDSAADKRLAALETLKLTPAEAVRNYPDPYQIWLLMLKKAEGQELPGAHKDIYERFAVALKLPEAIKGEDETKWLERLSPSQAATLEHHSPQRMEGDMQQSRLIRAVYSDRQLEEQMVDFWMNHFNVYMHKGMVQWTATSYERDAIRPNALGKFRDLLLATAHHPAMLEYLDNYQSAGPGPKSKGLNENYGREIMELHTLGVDGGYTQQDVIEVSRCFTGWTLTPLRDGPEYKFDLKMHDTGEKLVLGVKIPAGGGEQDALTVIDMLVKHPATAHFIATKLVRRFLADNPPEPVVARVAAAFRSSDGDIRETMRALFSSPEFLDARYYRAKVKNPLEFVASSLRASQAEIGVEHPPGLADRPVYDPSKGFLTSIRLAEVLARLGETLYLCGPPTGYRDTAETWTNTGLLLNRMNFTVALYAGRISNAKTPSIQVPRPPALSKRTEAVLNSEKDPVRLAELSLGSPEFQRR